MSNLTDLNLIIGAVDAPQGETLQSTQGNDAPTVNDPTSSTSGSAITPEALRAKLSEPDAPASTTEERTIQGDAISEEFAAKLAALPNDLTGMDLGDLFDQAQTREERRALRMKEGAWEPNPDNLGHTYNGPVSDSRRALSINIAKWQRAKARQVLGTPKTRVIREMVAAALYDFTQSPLLVVEDPTGQALANYCDALGDDTAAVVLISVSAKLLTELAKRVESCPIVFASEAETRGVQQRFESLLEAVITIDCALKPEESDLEESAPASAEEVEA